MPSCWTLSILCLIYFFLSCDTAVPKIVRAEFCSIFFGYSKFHIFALDRDVVENKLWQVNSLLWCFEAHCAESMPCNGRSHARIWTLRVLRHRSLPSVVFSVPLCGVDAVHWDISCTWWAPACDEMSVLPSVVCLALVVFRGPLDWTMGGLST